MAFSDIIFLVVSFTLFIIVVLVGDYLVTEQFIPAVNSSTNAPTNTTAILQSSWNNNTNFYDSSFGILFLLFAIISIVLTILIRSHPIMLIAWLLLNMLTLFIWDTLEDVLTAFTATPLDTGAMDNAQDFMAGIVPRAIPVLNILLAIALLGKSAMGGNSYE